MAISRRNHTISITDTYYTYTLSGSGYSIRQFTIVPGMVGIMLHQPDFDFPRPVRAVDPLRTATIVIDYQDNDGWEDNIITLSHIKRLVDGANSQAVRYSTDGDVMPVFLDVLPYGMSAGADTARSLILWGNVDDSTAYYDEASVRQYRMRTVTITLVLSEYAEASSQGTVTLSNDLTGSPGMAEYSGSSPTQFGYGVTRTAGTTCTINTTNWCVAGHSQQVEAAADTDGIDFPQITINDTSVAAFVWVRPVSGSPVGVQLYDVTAASVIETVTLDTANSSTYDRTFIDRAGGTWYRVEVSSTSWSSGNNGRIRVRADGGAATFLVDAAYLEIGADSAPNFGWMSARNIDNRNDHSSTNTSYINYIDVWDIPGDVPALCRVRATITSGADIYTEIVGAFTDGRYSIGDVIHWLEANDSDISTSVSAGASWTSTADAGRSAGNYQRFTPAIGASSGLLLWTTTGDEAKAFSRTDKRAFVLARTTSTGVTNGNSLRLSINGVDQSSGYTFTTGNTWELIDCGLLRTAGLMPAETIAGGLSVSPATAELAVGINVDTVSGANTVDIDAAVFVPLTEEFFIGGDPLNSGSELWLDGFQDGVIFNDPSSTYDNYMTQNYLGRFRQLRNHAGNRIVFLLKQENHAHTLTDSIAVKIDLKRRGRHLMGEQQ